MMIHSPWQEMKKNPISSLYGIAIGFLAFYYSVFAVINGAWDAALVDLVMALLLIYSMWRKINILPSLQPGRFEKITAWCFLLCANVLLFCCSSFVSAPLLQALIAIMLIIGGVFYFAGKRAAGCSLLPLAWCFIFIPFHEEIMLMASYPLRLSATMLSALLLKCCTFDVVYSGSSLQLAGLDIAITDACSGINQLDAFILLAYIAVKTLHKIWYLRLLHIAFIIPSIIIANTLRIVLTVLLFQWLGETVLEHTWHIALGYMQVIGALVIFLGFGKIFSKTAQAEEKTV